MGLPVLVDLTRIQEASEGMVAMYQFVLGTA
jgi:hypothetical protein